MNGQDKVSVEQRITQVIIDCQDYMFELLCFEDPEIAMQLLADPIYGRQGRILLRFALICFDFLYIIYSLT